MIAVEIILSMFGILLVIPVTVLVVQGVSAIFCAHRGTAVSGIRPRVAVLIPAHNESAGIEQTLRSILCGLDQQDRLLVVADNCSDDTASLARAAGAQVIERHDPIRKGKGFALDFGIRHLESDPPEIVIVIDADCTVHGETIRLLAQQAFAYERPVQAMDLMQAPTGAGIKTRIAELAWLLKNKVRPMGFHNLGLPCPLMGTGMAFPWELIKGAELASGHLVEDLKLGIELTRAGRPPVFCPEALVTSVFPVSETGLQGQRSRWEHGHLGVILSDAPTLFLEAIKRRSGQLLAMALDLCVPPLALLTIMVGSLTGASLLFWLVSGQVMPLVLSGFTMLLLTGTVLLVWDRFGRGVISLASLVYAPVYALGKIPLYLRFFMRRQVEWVRSQRGPQ